MRTTNTDSYTKSENIASRVRNTVNEIISFSGISEYCCVGIVDIVNSTNITAKLPHAKVCAYYSTFLNTMSRFVKGFGATTVKNIGDSLLYYFPKISDPDNKHAFNEVVDCGMMMIEARTAINEKMYENKLPDLDYRISADYGCIMIADSMTSFNKDVFGSPVNICNKINSMTPPNTMVIGSDLYQHVKDKQDYYFKEIRACTVGHKYKYPIYSVQRIG